MEPPVSYLIQAGLLSNALLFSASAVYLWWLQSQRMQTYLPVAATILSASVSTTAERRHPIRDAGGRTPEIDRFFRPAVRYQYTVDGKDYTACQVLPLDERATWRSYANCIVDRYAAGQLVEAYYNPVAPSQAFLEKRYAALTYIMPAAAATDWVLTLVICYFLFWRR